MINRGNHAGLLVGAVGDLCGGTVGGADLFEDAVHEPDNPFIAVHGCPAVIQTCFNLVNGTLHAGGERLNRGLDLVG